MGCNPWSIPGSGGLPPAPDPPGPRASGPGGNSHAQSPPPGANCLGDTAEGGDYSLIYQGVTLGGTGKQSGKRHPTLGKNVVVGAGAKVLGNLKIGNNVRIGAGSVVLRDVPSDCTVVGIPGRIVYQSGVKVNPLEHGNLPDSEGKVIRLLLDRIEALEKQVEALQEDKLKERELVVSGVSNCATNSGNNESQSCYIKDKEIEEFLGGTM